MPSLDEQIDLVSAHVNMYKSDLRDEKREGRDEPKELWLQDKINKFEAILQTLRSCKEPTHAMVDAGAKAINKQMRGSGSPADWHAAMDCFRAMVSANAQGGGTQAFRR